MKILLSAYACSPKQGSECALGWNWAVELAGMGHEVWVLTRTVYRDAIEDEAARYPNLHFIYMDLPAFLCPKETLGKGVHLHNLIWNFVIAKKARRLHRQHRFDLVHYVTLSDIRTITWLAELDAPFVYGPVGGGSISPFQIRLSYGFKGFLLEYYRDFINNFFLRFLPFHRKMFGQALEIYVNSHESRDLLPKKYHDKTHIQINAFIEPSFIQAGEQAFSGKIFDTDRPFRLLYVGRAIYWKGMGLAIESFAEFLKTVPDAQFTILSNERDMPYWKKQVGKRNLENNVHFVSSVDLEGLYRIYAEHDVFVFPSRDSGGMVVLEALSFGLPVICLDIGGPDFIVTPSCGKAVTTVRQTKKQIIQGLAAAMVFFFKERGNLPVWGVQAKTRSHDFTSEAVVRQIYRSLEQKLNVTESASRR